ncbi:MAG: SGNH/GDSL hydrolase family protein [Planctomycetota bacterium]|jgi:lysophospholipase L1-like esterase
MAVVIEDGAVVLFQGDSITDYGRSREDDSQLGSGYAGIAAAIFSAMHPELNVRFLNRGIAGNRVKDLKARWTEDCIKLKPTWVSIMIGVNDTWRRFDSNDPTSTEAFEADYREILARTRDEITAKLILCEPFLLPYPEDRKSWREDLDPRIHVVGALAREFDAILVPLDGIFADASAKRECAYWAFDGVHPTAAGSALIAISWLKAVGAM